MHSQRDLGSCWKRRREGGAARQTYCKRSVDVAEWRAIQVRLKMDGTAAATGLLLAVGLKFAKCRLRCRLHERQMSGDCDWEVESDVGQSVWTEKAPVGLWVSSSHLAEVVIGDCGRPAPQRTAPRPRAAIEGRGEGRECVNGGWGACYCSSE